MPNAVINGNVLTLTVNAKGGTLNLDMSLQRHHYRYCSGGAGQPLNSLLYYSVTDAQVIADAEQVGDQMTKLLDKNHKPQALFGVSFQCTSGRAYLVDNNQLNPNGFPNHFFVTTGPAVWKSMTLAEYTAASLIRRVEEAIETRPAKSRMDYLDVKSVHKIRHEPGGTQNPVVAAYIAAHTQLGLVPAADPSLTAVSGQEKIVSVARELY